MKILIVTGLTLPEVTEEEMKAIYVASGEGDIVVASSEEEALENWPEDRVATQPPTVLRSMDCG